MSIKEKQWLIEEAIKFETNISDLYAIFSNAHKEHAEFWSRLSLEEKGHATLIKNAAARCDLDESLPTEIVSESLTKLEHCNHHIEALLKQFQDAPPSPDDAFNIALELEQSGGEIHYQKFMNTGDDSSLDKVFQKLDQEDKSHSTQLHAYMEKYGIPIVDYLE